jgi:hypothetical protein
LLDYIQTLLDHGFTEPEIREMSSTHARELLGV